MTVKGIGKAAKSKVMTKGNANSKVIFGNLLTRLNGINSYLIGRKHCAVKGGKGGGGRKRARKRRKNKIENRVRVRSDVPAAATAPSRAAVNHAEREIYRETEFGQFRSVARTLH